ncbi:MAG TPA: hypothetical protein VHB70_03905, partial [Parafilimonas sp.]|nr:hypothetical protein [Parafilimonas sp.]
MKILLLTRNLPYPLSAGGKIAQYSIIDALRKLCTLVLVVNIYSNYDREQVDILKQRWPDVEFREIQFLRQGGKISFKEKLRNTLRKGFKKLTAGRILSDKESAGDTRDTDNSYLIHLFEIKQRKLVDEVSAIIADVRPDIVQIEIIDYVDLVTLIPGNIKRV